MVGISLKPSPLKTDTKNSLKSFAMPCNPQVPSLQLLSSSFLNSAFDFVLLIYSKLSAIIFSIFCREVIKSFLSALLISCLYLICHCYELSCSAHLSKLDFLNTDFFPMTVYLISLLIHAGVFLWGFGFDFGFIWVFFWRGGLVGFHLGGGGLGFWGREVGVVVGWLF